MTVTNLKLDQCINLGGPANGLSTANRDLSTFTIGALIRPISMFYLALMWFKLFSSYLNYSQSISQP